MRCRHRQPQRPADDQVGPGQTVTLNSNLVNALNPTYLWCTLPCTTTSNQPQFTFAPDLDSYAVGLAWEGGCLATDFVTFVLPVGIPQASVGEFSLSPNPATDFLTLRVSRPLASPAQIRLLNPLGQQVRSFEMTGKEQVLSLEGLSKGVYLLEFSRDASKEVRRVLIR